MGKFISSRQKRVEHLLSYFNALSIHFQHSPGSILQHLCIAGVIWSHITASLHCWSHLELYYYDSALLVSSGAILLQLCIAGVTWSHTTALRIAGVTRSNTIASLNCWSHLEPYYSVSALLGHLEPYYSISALLESPGSILQRLCIAGVIWSHTTANLHCWSHLEPYYSTSHCRSHKEQYYYVSKLLKSSGAILQRLCIAGVICSHIIAFLHCWSNLDPYYSTSHCR